jgi:hypothetical protein
MSLMGLRRFSWWDISDTSKTMRSYHDGSSREVYRCVGKGEKSSQRHHLGLKYFVLKDYQRLVWICKQQFVVYYI